MRFFLIVCFAFLAIANLSAQKMLLIERANIARTQKLYIGDELIFRLEGEENYWYKRTITDIMPESGSVLLDGYLVQVADITAIKINKKRIWRFIGSVLVSFGASLIGAAVGSALYRDADTPYWLLFGGAALCAPTGLKLLQKRTLRLNENNRLRAIEINFDKWKQGP